MSSVHITPPRIEPVSLGHKFHTTVDVLRLDEVHPLVSGNKWFKLRFYLAEAETQRKKILVTFGGAYSNHILATAAAARETGFESIGIIRGEPAAGLTPTLLDAEAQGMKLVFVSREAYRERKVPEPIAKDHHPDDLYIIPEGGYGHLGADGAGTIMSMEEMSSYDYILTAVGTGTTMAGLASASARHQFILGVPVLKGDASLENDVKVLAPEARARCRFIPGYHFGGYARHRPELFRFMNEFYEETGIPTDFVYNGKLFYAVRDLLAKEHFASGSRILVVHSGGLQGNRSLPKGTLIF